MEEKVAKTGEIIYTGFCIELLDRLQQDMKFRYRIEVLPSNQYGSWNVFSQKWNGIIEHLIERVSSFLFIAALGRLRWEKLPPPSSNRDLRFLVKDIQSESLTITSLITKKLLEYHY